MANQSCIVDMYQGGTIKYSASLVHIAQATRASDDYAPSSDLRCIQYRLLVSKSHDDK